VKRADSGITMHFDGSGDETSKRYSSGKASDDGTTVSSEELQQGNGLSGLTFYLGYSCIPSATNNDLAVTLTFEGSTRPKPINNDISTPVESGGNGSGAAAGSGTGSASTIGNNAGPTTGSESGTGSGPGSELVTAVIVNGPPEGSVEYRSDVTIGGAGVESYRWNLQLKNSLCTENMLSAWSSVLQPITLSLPSDGRYTLCVQGKNSSGTIQQGISSHQWSQGSAIRFMGIKSASYTSFNSVLIDWIAGSALTGSLGGYYVYGGPSRSAIDYSAPLYEVVGEASTSLSLHNVVYTGDFYFAVRAFKEGATESNILSRCLSEGAFFINLSNLPETGNSTPLSIGVAGANALRYEYEILKGDVDCALAASPQLRDINALITDTPALNSYYTLCVKGIAESNVVQQSFSRHVWYQGTLPSFLGLEGVVRTGSEGATLSWTPASTIATGYNVYSGASVNSIDVSAPYTVIQGERSSSLSIAKLEGGVGPCFLVKAVRNGVLLENPAVKCLAAEALPVTMLSGLPQDGVLVGSIEVTVSGSNTSDYQFALIPGISTCNGAIYSSWRALSQPILLANLARVTQHTLCVRGKTSLGLVQQTPTFYTWDNGTQFNFTGLSSSGGGSVTSVSPTSLHIGWQAGSTPLGPVDGYYVYSASNGQISSATPLVTVTDGTSTGVDITGLTSGTTYCFAVKAFEGNELSQSAAIQCGTTSVSTPFEGIQSIAATSVYSVRATWNPVADAEKYLLYTRDMFGTYNYATPAKEVTGSSTSSAVVSSLYNNMDYCVVVRVVRNAQVESNTTEKCTRPNFLWAELKRNSVIIRNAQSVITGFTYDVRVLGTYSAVTYKYAFVSAPSTFTGSQYQQLCEAATYSAVRPISTAITGSVTTNGSGTTKYLICAKGISADGTVQPYSNYGEVPWVD